MAPALARSIGSTERERFHPFRSQPFSDQVLDVLVDGRHRREAEALADLLEARGVPARLDELAHEVVDLTLSAGQGHRGLLFAGASPRRGTEAGAKVQAHGLAPASPARYSAAGFGNRHARVPSELEWRHSSPADPLAAPLVAGRRGIGGSRFHEDASASRPLLVKRIEGEAKTQGRDHHPGHRQGEAPGGQGDRSRQRPARPTTARSSPSR